jgi:hypothetical protein
MILFSRPPHNELAVTASPIDTTRIGQLFIYAHRRTGILSGNPIHRRLLPPAGKTSIRLYKREQI